LQKYFAEVTGQDLVIINKPGGAGALSWSEMNGLEPDGYALTLVSLPHNILQPIVTPGVGYAFEDITSVLMYTSVPQVLAVPIDSEIETIEDFIAMAREKPGQMTIAGTGSGGSNHSAYHLFDKAAGIKTTYIPFRDTASTVAALKGGQTTAAWTWTTQGVVDGDLIRMLGIAADERMAVFPDLPTIKEQGIDMADQAWWAIGIPKSSSEEVRRKVAEVFKDVMNHPKVSEDMLAAGYSPFIVDYDQVAEFKKGLVDLYVPVAEAIRN
jgi:tripartite-type tricarboxylate transporter receptor subunit TctC